MKNIQLTLIAFITFTAFNLNVASANMTCHDLLQCAKSEYDKAIFQEAGKTLKALNEKWTPILKCCKEHKTIGMIVQVWKYQNLAQLL